MTRLVNTNSLPDAGSRLGSSGKLLDIGTPPGLLEQLLFIYTLAYVRTHAYLCTSYMYIYTQAHTYIHMCMYIYIYGWHKSLTGFMGKLSQGTFHGWGLLIRSILHLLQLDLRFWLRQRAVSFGAIVKSSYVQPGTGLAMSEISKSVP